MDFNKKILVKNTANCNVAFRAINTRHDVVVSPMAKTPISADEILAQVYGGNKLFCGIDGKGNHASLYIEDEEMRVECNFESPEQGVKQEIIDKAAILNLFNAKTVSAFKKDLSSKIKTETEKRLLKNILENNEVNDLNKAKAAAVYLGISL